MKIRKIFNCMDRLRGSVAFVVSLLLCLNAQLLFAQGIHVKGVVNDALGPVIGASVVEKGNTGNGTITDIDGNFSLQVPANATIVISFIGYKTQEIPVNGQKSLTVQLVEDSEMLEEVVV